MGLPSKESKSQEEISRGDRPSIKVREAVDERKARTKNNSSQPVKGDRPNVKVRGDWSLP